MTDESWFLFIDPKRRLPLRRSTVLVHVGTFLEISDTHIKDTYVSPGAVYKAAGVET